MAMLREAALGEVRAARKQANTTPNFQFGVEDAVTAQVRAEPRAAARLSIAAYYRCSIAR